MEDVCPDEEIPDHVNPNPSPALPAPPPPLAFDMMEFMHKASSYDIMEVIREAEAMPLIPLHTPSKRPGGEARREIMKAKTMLNWRHWPYCYLQHSCNQAHNAPKRAAYYLSSICSEKIEGIQSSRFYLRTPAQYFTWGL